MPRNEVVVLDCVCFSVNAWFRELWRHNDGIYTWIHSVWDITEGLGVKCTARHCLKTLDHHLPWWLLMVRRPGSLHVTLLLWSPTSCCSVPRPCHSAELLRTLVNCGFDTFVSSWCAGPFTCWCRSSAYWLSRVIIKWVNLIFFCFVFFPLCLVLYLPLWLNVWRWEHGFRHSTILISTRARNVLLFPVCWISLVLLFLPLQN